MRALPNFAVLAASDESRWPEKEVARLGIGRGEQYNLPNTDRLLKYCLVPSRRRGACDGLLRHSA